MVPCSSDRQCTVEERWATLRDGRVRYLFAGTGPPLVLIHGLLAYSFSWRFNIPALAEHFTVYAPDLLGTGFSDRPHGLEYDLSSTAARVRQFLQQLGITSCGVVGTSQGGAVAMMLAALNPGLVNRMVLSAPVNPWSKHGRLITRVLGLAVAGRLFRVAFPRARFTHPYVLRRLYGDLTRIPADSLAGYSAPFELPNGLDYGLSVVRTWRKDLAQLEASLPKIAHIPTLLIWGSLDRAVLPESGPILREYLPNAELLVFEGAGHLPYEEIPERFNREVLDFLRRSPAYTSK